MKKLLISVVLLFLFLLVNSQDKNTIVTVPEIAVQYDFYSQCKLGTVFKALDNGYLLTIKLLANSEDGGDHIIRLWENTGNQNILLSGPFVWNIPSGTSGWIEFEFPHPFQIIKNKIYILSIGGSIDTGSANSKTLNKEKDHDFKTNQEEQYPTDKSSVLNSKWYVTNSLRIKIIAAIKLAPGTIGYNQTICFNEIPETLKQITAPSGGIGTYIYQWQSSPDTINWTDISNANGTDYSPPSLSTNTWFRRKVTSGRFPSITSNPVLISIYPIFNAGSIGISQTVCYNSAPSPLKQISPPSGGTGSYTYQWQGSSDNSQWADIPGADQSEYSPPALTGSKWYKRKVISGHCSNLSTNVIRITVNPVLVAGTIGSDQSICYGTIPASLVQITPAGGGTGVYTYQWQRSSDNINWTNISDANSVTYSPPSLTESTWFRRNIPSGCSGNSNSVKITLYPPLNSAQLYRSKTIYENTSTTFNVAISGGNRPYNVNYTLNGVSQPAITDYVSGSDLSTGNLATGVYIYSLTSVTDLNGCSAQNLGTNITLTVQATQISQTNKALIIVNSASSFYTDYVNYIKPYLDNFGIPYDVCNINATALTSFKDYAIVIFGHKNVFSSGYPITQLEDAVSDGVGLYSFDPHLFDYSSRFNTTITERSVNSNRINYPNTKHYITQCHAPDTFNPSSNFITTLSSWKISQKSSLVGGVDLATMSPVSLLQVSNFGKGHIVRWNSYDWVFEEILGPVFGMDDLIWRSIVWAARKPFVIQGLPPMVTMRVDDADGNGVGIENNFEWVRICNEFRIIPWISTFNNNIPQEYIPTLRSLINNNHATASPHAFGYNPGRYRGFIYFNHDNLPSFNVAERTRYARDFYIQNGLPISKYFVPHYYEISSEALPEIYAMGGEFIGLNFLPDNSYDPAPSWINSAPYRINRYGTSSTSNKRPVSYAGFVNLNGIEFFNCLTEIRDDGGYEWYPQNDAPETIARGIRHLRRAFNSMVLSTLFTHEEFLSGVSATSWRDILRKITNAISGYNPEYTSMDYTVQYLRAKSNIRITNVQDNLSSIDISYSGNNDMDTKCYLFTENNGQIEYRFIALPQIDGFGEVSVLK